MFMVARRPVVGSGRYGRVPDVVVARPTSATGGQGHGWAERAEPRTGAGPRCRCAGSARTGRDRGPGRSTPPPPGRRGRASPTWPSGTRSASGAAGAGPSRPGPWRSGSAPRWSNHKRQVLLHAAGAAGLVLVAPAAPFATIWAPD